MTVEYLKWDSHFFNLKIGQSTEGVVCKPCHVRDFDLIYVKHSGDEVVKIDGFVKNFEETKVLFEKQSIKFNIFNFKTEIFDTEVAPLNRSVLYELAFISGGHSRFKLDTNFKENSFFKLYRVWIDKSISKEIAEKIFYIFCDNIVAGFVSLSQENGFAKIGLIAVHPKFQGRGFGEELIMACEFYCIKNNLSKLVIPTQKENTGACKFYSKVGYSIVEQIVISHFWRVDF